MTRTSSERLMHVQFKLTLVSMGICPPKGHKKVLSAFILVFVLYVQFTFCVQREKNLCKYCKDYSSIHYPLDTERKFNVHKTSRTSSERLMYVQFKLSLVSMGICPPKGLKKVFSAFILVFVFTRFVFSAIPICICV